MCTAQTRGVEVEWPQQKRLWPCKSGGEEQCNFVRRETSLFYLTGKTGAAQRCESSRVWRYKLASAFPHLASATSRARVNMIHWRPTTAAGIHRRPMHWADG